MQVEFVVLSTTKCANDYLNDYKLVVAETSWYGKDFKWETIGYSNLAFAANVGQKAEIQFKPFKL